MKPYLSKEEWKNELSYFFETAVYLDKISNENNSIIYRFLKSYWDDRISVYSRDNLRTIYRSNTNPSELVSVYRLIYTLAWYLTDEEFTNSLNIFYVRYLFYILFRTKQESPNLNDTIKKLIDQLTISTTGTVQSAVIPNIAMLTTSNANFTNPIIKDDKLADILSVINNSEIEGNRKLEAIYPKYMSHIHSFKTLYGYHLIKEYDLKNKNINFTNMIYFYNTRPFLLTNKGEKAMRISLIRDRKRLLLERAITSAIQYVINKKANLNIELIYNLASSEFYLDIIVNGKYPPLSIKVPNIKYKPDLSDLKAEIVKKYSRVYISNKKGNIKW